MQYRIQCRIPSIVPTSGLTDQDLFDVGWNFIFKMTAIDVPVPREPLWIVMLWSQQLALHVNVRVHKLEISISCFHSQLQQSKSPLRGFGMVAARFGRDPFELRNISNFLAQLGAQVQTDFRLNNNLSRTVSHERGVVNSSLSVQIAGTSPLTLGSDLF